LVEGVNCVELADEYGTPLFVISENAIRDNYRRFYKAFKSRYPQDIVVCVGMKANLGLAIRKIIVQEGGGGDAFGLGELYVALLAVAEPEAKEVAGSFLTTQVKGGLTPVYLGSFAGGKGQGNEGFLLVVPQFS
jgi:diaminopimelate decarboxylase